MASPMKPKPRPYRDFLTPALHRQFTHAAGLSLVLCYVEACLISNSPRRSSFRAFCWFETNSWRSVLWRWQPLGMTGIRTLLLFISSLLIFLLRVANQHVGTTTSTYPIQTALWRIFSYGPVGTASCYFFSAWFFSEIYLSSLPSKANLGYVDDGRMSGRLQLNERAVYFRTQFLWLSCVQTLFHLVGDYDKLSLPSRKSLSTQGIIDPKVRVLQKLGKIITASCIKLILSLGVGTLLYFAAFRHAAWNCFFVTTKYMFFWTRRAGPKGPVPDAFLDLLSRSLFAEFAILLLWDWTNAVFSEYIAEPPLKKGKPLTDDSKDPNGSLLGGLRAKRQMAKVSNLNGQLRG
jgi:nucleoporin NDC1